MKKLSFINRFLPSYKWKVAAIIICGVVVGGGSLFMYLLRAHTYLGDEPSACVNCHIMAPYYATWFHSSHSRPLVMIVMFLMRMPLRNGHSKEWTV